MRAVTKAKVSEYVRAGLKICVTSSNKLCSMPPQLLKMRGTVGSKALVPLSLGSQLFIHAKACLDILLDDGMKGGGEGFMSKRGSSGE